MKEILEYTLFEIGNVKFTLKGLLFLILFNTGVSVFLVVLKKSINKFERIEKAKRYSIYSLLKYLIIVIAIVISLQLIGFNLSLLLAGSAALLVGLGLGIQYLFSDYISGIILLMDSTIKVGDIIETNGIICRVEEINLRTTKIRTRDDKFIVLPNTDLTRNQLINWTMNDLISRFDVTIGVDYSSDVALVMKIMKDAALMHEGVVEVNQPFVRFNDCADSALIFTVYFWVNEVFRVENIKSDLRVKIFADFKKHGVTIPFPQRVIHYKKDDN